MKRKSLSILFALFAIMVSAQSGHLKFMGIPINGTINEFQNKLLAKGFRVDTFSKSIPLGTRMFNGMFMGKKADIYVYYIPVTKTVYRAKACIEKEDEKQIKSLYDETQSMLEDKYIGFSKSDTQDGFDSWGLLVSRYPEDENAIWHRSYGVINLYISKYTESYPITYTLHIDYIDQINSDKNTNTMQDDL